MLILQVDSIENLRRGAMEKMNLGYEILREINPRVIYASVSGIHAYCLK